MLWSKSSLRMQSIIACQWPLSNLRCAAFSGTNFVPFPVVDLQVHVSFSQLGGAAAGDDKSQTHIGNSFLSLLLQSVGVAVTEVQDVEFKWAT